MNMIKNKLFTLVELMVVVLVLSILSSVVIASWDGLISQTSKQLTQIEMNNIRQAIIQFKRDTGHFPGQGPFQSEDGDEPPSYARARLFINDANKGNVTFSPIFTDFNDNTAREQWMLSYANLYQLALQPKDDSGDAVLPYDIDNQRGWNGPYISPSSFNLISIINNSSHLSTTPDPTDNDHFNQFLTGVNNRPNSNSDILTQVWGLIDKFNKPQKISNFGEINDNLQIYDRDEITNANAQDKLLESRGMPYLLFIDNTTPTNSRLVSAGENNKYGDDDDIIVYIE